MTDTASSPTEIVEGFLEAFVAMDFDTALTLLILRKAADGPIVFMERLDRLPDPSAA